MKFEDKDLPFVDAVYRDFVYERKMLKTHVGDQPKPSLRLVIQPFTFFVIWTRETDITLPSPSVLSVTSCRL